MADRKRDEESSSSTTGTGVSDFSGQEEGTRVDLGEDLLAEETAILRRVRPPASAPEGVLRGDSEPKAPPPFDPSDAMESAQILLREGLLEEAKKTLRRVLLHDAGNVSARRLLADIHEQELKQIFSEHQPSRLQRRMGRVRDPLQGVDPSAVLRRLDHDLRLGFREESEDGAAVSAKGLFADYKALERFATKLDTDLKDLGPRDRMDVGIAFLEMGIPEVAVRQFEAVITMCRKATDPEPGMELSAACLTAGAYLSHGKPYEAMQAVERYLRDTEIGEGDKIHLLYLMGRALEAAQRPHEAREWYARVAEIDPAYRDVRERLARPQEGGAR
ncbi:MAG TPA: hypothetical protein VL588_08165 [Bdellovibrionota bacterium]|nr:hypothetical protein [Bdellovibrionota bacterium]